VGTARFLEKTRAEFAEQAGSLAYGGCFYLTSTTVWLDVADNTVDAGLFIPIPVDFKVSEFSKKLREKVQRLTPHNERLN
jgi:hypothetical protein